MIPAPDLADRKGRGVFYTPPDLVDRVLDRVLAGFVPERILDPSCGAGAFLLGVWRYLSRRLMGPDGLAIETRLRLVASLHGVDLDPVAIAEARRALAREADVPEEACTGIVQGDALLGDIPLLKDHSFDLVVGNPPWVRVQRGETAILERLRRRYRAMNGAADLYVAFVERSLELLAPGGRVGLLVPDRFQEADYGRELRKMLGIARMGEAAATVHPGGYRCRVLDLDATRPFPGISAYPCLLEVSVDSRFPPGTENPEWGGGWPEAHTGPTLGQLLDQDPMGALSRGSSTGADAVFLLRMSPSGLIDARDRHVDLEPGLLRIPIRGRDRGGWRTHPANGWRAIFTEGLTEDELRTRFPKAWDYLSAHRSLLGSRRTGVPWWAWSAPRRPDIQAGASVLFPLLARERLASSPPSMEGVCLLAGGGSALRLRSDRYAPEALLGILASKTAFRLLASFAPRFQGGWIGCAAAFLRRLPLPVIQSMEERRILGEVRDAVLEILRLEDSPPFDTARHAELADTVDERVQRLYGR